MSYDLIFLLEERSTKNVLEVILPQLIPEYIRILVSWGSDCSRKSV